MFSKTTANRILPISMLVPIEIENSSEKLFIWTNIILCHFDSFILPEPSTTPTSRFMWTPWRRSRWSRTWRCWTSPPCSGGRSPRPPTTSGGTTENANTSTFWPSPKWASDYFDTENFFKQCFIGASILPDLHPCRRSSQEKADALNCSGPDPKHNTGVLNSSILRGLALN